jgi:hypothetical protein
MSREEFISINESMVDDDLMTVPKSDGLMISRSSSSVSNIIEEMIQDQKIKVVDADCSPPKEQVNTNDCNGSSLSEKSADEKKDLVTQANTTSDERSENSSYPGLQVLDENGEQHENIVWHDPGTYNITYTNCWIGE